MTPEYYEKWYWRLREYIGEEAYIELYHHYQEILIEKALKIAEKEE